MTNRQGRPTVGQSVVVSRQVVEADLDSFAELSLDRNPIHFDDDFAAKTIFGARIAHGMIGAALISGALTRLMGDGNIWLSASLDFQGAVYLGDSLDAKLTVASMDRRGVATMEVAITNQDGRVVIGGQVRSMCSAANPIRTGANDDA